MTSARREMQFWLMVALRTLLVVALGIWLWPPEPLPVPMLPASWDPGCPQQQAEWKDETHAGQFHTKIQPLAMTEGWLLYSQKDRLEEITLSAHGPNEEIYKRLPIEWQHRFIGAIIRGERLWVAIAEPDRLQMLELDWPTMEQRGTYEQGLSFDSPNTVNWVGTDLLELPDGTFGVVVHNSFAGKQESRFVTFDPATRAFVQHERLPNLRDMYSLILAPDGALLAEGARIIEPIAVDLRSGRTLALTDAHRECSDALTDRPSLLFPVRPPAHLVPHGGPRRGLGWYALQARLKLWQAIRRDGYLSGMLASRYMIEEVRIAQGPIKGPAIRTIDGDVAMVANSTAAKWTNVGAFGEWPGTVPMTQVNAGLWVYRTTRAESLIVQAVSSPPEAINEGMSLLRIGKLRWDANDIEWLSWVSLPKELNFVQRIDPILFVENDRVSLAIFGSTTRLGRPSSGGTFWMQFPEPAGIDLPERTPLYADTR